MDACSLKHCFSLDIMLIKNLQVLIHFSPVNQSNIKSFNMLFLLHKIYGIAVDVLLLGFISSLPQHAWENDFNVVVTVDVLPC
jgi:hypothetical protein